MRGVATTGSVLQESLTEDDLEKVSILDTYVVHLWWEGSDHTFPILSRAWKIHHLL